MVQAIHDHQFQLLHKKTNILTEVEIAGLGRYYLSLKRAKNKLRMIKGGIYNLKKKLERGNTTPFTAIMLNKFLGDEHLLEDKIRQANEFKSSTGVSRTYTKYKKS